VKLEFIYKLICLLFIFANIYLIIIYFPYSGWDFKVYLAAKKAVNNRENPYLFKNIYKYTKNPYLTFLYPPLTLTILKFIPDNYKIFYYIFYTILLIVIGYLTFTFFKENQEDILLLVTVLICGFTAVFYNYQTGNTGLIELLFFLFFLRYFYKNSIISAVCLGVLSYLKLFPVVFAVCYLITPKPLKLKVKDIACAGIVILILFSISYLIYPEFTRTYFLSIRGKLNQPSPLYEPGGYINPSLWYVISTRILRIKPWKPDIKFFIVYIFISFLIVFPLLKRKWEDRYLYYFNFFIGITLLLPRLKPYSYTYALVPAYLLLRIKKTVYKFIGILLISLPSLYLQYLILNNTYKSIYAFLQFYSLLMFFIFSMLTSKKH